MLNQRLRFTTNDDLQLLREVLCQNPFEDAARWKTISQNLLALTAKQFSVRATREHFDHLLKLFKAGDTKNLRKSSTEDQYNEKEQLLQKASVLLEEFKNMPKKERLKEKLNHYNENVDRDIDNINNSSQLCSVEVDTISSHNTRESANFMTDDMEFSPVDELIDADGDSNSGDCEKTMMGSIHTCKHGHSLKSANLTFIQERHRTETRLKEKQLELEERKLLLDEKRLGLEQERFALEKLERESRLKLEQEERKQMMQFAEQQQKIINYLLERKQDG